MVSMIFIYMLKTALSVIIIISVFAISVLELLRICSIDVSCLLFVCYTHVLYAIHVGIVDHNIILFCGFHCYAIARIKYNV